jgi:NtrC-family two-component system response regulator AlgB
MKLLLIGSETKMRRLIPSEGPVADQQTVIVSRGRDLVSLPGLLEFGVAVIDWEMESEHPADLLMVLKRHAPDLPVVAITKDDACAIEARMTGAVEAVLKPVNLDAFRSLLARVAKPGAKLPANLAPVQEIKFVTQSPRMESLLSVAWRVAPTSASVLILGENGTGKTLLARAIHHRSVRAQKPFVSVNCPCLQPQLLESELFGHVRGAFTGAVSDTAGKVAAAEGGTLFLDELGEMPLEVQAKLLRLLQERCFERLGESRTRLANIRVIAATNRDLKQQVTAGLFREDLFYRLNVITLEMPPLRSRPEDILPSAEYFLSVVTESVTGKKKDFSPAARQALLGHSWPGNLRELRNVVERAAILCDRELLDVSDFPELSSRADTLSSGPQVGEFVTLDMLVEAHIRQVTARAESYEQAARILGIDKSTLYRWRKRLENFQPVPDVETSAFAG